MLCKRPLIENVVFNDFKIDVHVAEVGYDPNMPLYRAIDFGFVNPFVCMWIQVDGKGCVRVIDEYTRSRAAIAVHGENIKGRFNCREESIAATFCDPAGVGRNDVTGTSAVRELRAMGIRTKYRKSSILEGIELVRRALRAGDGSSKLIIAPKCVRLIEAMQCYHYPDSGSVESGSEMPVKDGVYDHHIDALRYFFVNYLKKTKTTMRRY
jgi:phage terminase large subunit